MPGPSTVTLARVDRARGCLLGLAIGDALGAPLEGLTDRQILSNYGRVRDYVDGSRAWKRRPFQWRLPGLYSDDTQQALGLAYLLVETGEVDPARLCQMYLDLATPRGAFYGAHRGVGKSFRKVLDALSRQTPPDQTSQDSAGIGAAMRVPPAAIHAQGDPEQLYRATLHATLFSHHDVRSVAGALAVALATQRLLDEEDLVPSFALRLAADVYHCECRILEEFPGTLTNFDPYAHNLSRALSRIEAILELPRDQALGLILDEANRNGLDANCKRPTQGYVLSLIPTCLYVLLTTSSFEEALVEVINLGGDADSAGAVLGAWAGAHYGVQALPSRWRDGLKNQDGIDRIAHALDQSPSTLLDLPDYAAVERYWSSQEQAYCERIMRGNPKDHAGKS